jgi:hypothetical protein
MSWQGKSDELNYKMSLMQKYKEMKEEFGWTDEKIIYFCGG